MPDTSAGRHTLYMLVAIVVMSILSVVGIVMVVVFAPGDQQASLITAVLTVTAPVVATVILLVKQHETARLAERAANHAKANTEQVAAVQKEVQHLTVQVDGRLTQLVESLAKEAVMRQEIGRGLGMVEGRAAGKAEADALTAARNEVPPATEMPATDPEP